MFQPIFNLFTITAGITDTIVKSEYKGLSNEKTKPFVTETKGLSPKLKWMHNSKARVEFKGSSLKQGKVIFILRNVVSLLSFPWIRCIVTSFKH